MARHQDSGPELVRTRARISFRHDCTGFTKAAAHLETTEKGGFPFVAGQTYEMPPELAAYLCGCGWMDRVSETDPDWKPGRVEPEVSSGPSQFVETQRTEPPPGDRIES